MEGAGLGRIPDGIGIQRILGGGVLIITVVGIGTLIMVGSGAQDTIGRQRGWLGGAIMTIAGGRLFPPNAGGVLELAFRGLMVVPQLVLGSEFHPTDGTPLLGIGSAILAFITLVYLDIMWGSL